MKYRLVIFDMDGTLADSYPWFLSILSAVCDKFGLRPIGPQDIDALRGSDSARILEWLEVPRWKLPVIVRHMRALKAQHLHEIPLFPGVSPLLAALASARGHLALRQLFEAQRARHRGCLYQTNLDNVTQPVHGTAA